MFSNCCLNAPLPSNPYRQTQNQSSSNPSSKFHHQNIHSQSIYDHSQQSNHADTPLRVKLLNATGLSQLMIDKFIFARPLTKYQFHPQEMPQKFTFSMTNFKFIPGYQTTCALIDLQNHFIPVIHFKKLPLTHENLNEQQRKIMKSGLTMVYSHGNSSNLQLSFQIVQMMAKKYPIDYIVYDYTGYGNGCAIPKKFIQANHKLSDKSICSDLIQVIKWSQVPSQKIILWGYSLGCHPSLYAATEIKCNSLILQCPFASIYSMVSGLHSEGKPYKNDIFSNLELIGNIKCDCLLIHSQDDDLISSDHSKMLVKKFNQTPKLSELRFIEIGNIKHNEMPVVFCVRKSNPLQEQLMNYLLDRAKNLNTQNTKKQNHMRKKPIQLKGSLESLEEKFSFVIDHESLSLMSQSMQSSVKNIEAELRQQNKRYFPAISKRNVSMGHKSSNTYSNMNFPTMDTEISDEILLSEKQIHEKKLKFGNLEGSDTLRSKKKCYQFSMI